jgi:hypothetical protein
MEIPKIVETFRELLSDKLGREAIVRKVKNRDEYFILDLAFSYFQKADRNRRNDYRSGFLIGKNDKGYYLLFILAYSPVMLSFFKENFDFKLFSDIIIETSSFRKTNFLRIDKGSKEKGIRLKVKHDNIDNFIEEINKLNNKGFARSYLSNSTNSKTGIDNVFVLLLAESLNSDTLLDLISISWDLFLWLYPSKLIFKRNASLNRSLQKVEQKCEIKDIKNVPQNILNMSCNGQIEGAHIIPHKNGGSDKLENGLWLCNLHHRLTEGKIEGNRDLRKIYVRYKDK